MYIKERNEKNIDKKSIKQIISKPKQFAAWCTAAALSSVLITTNAALAISDIGTDDAGDTIETAALLNGYEGEPSFTAWQESYSQQKNKNTILVANIQGLVKDNPQYVSDETKERVSSLELADTCTTIALLADEYEKLDNEYKSVAAEIKAAYEKEQAEKAAAEKAQKIAEFPDDLDAGSWSDDKVSFVSSWGKRLNSYLSGSTLSGYGYHFAAAAYDADIDPRTSAAISCIESGKGASCFRSHNAWGWGSSSWSSWSEAIFAHARGLAQTYGYDMSASDCATYCPGSGSYYSILQSEMNQI